VGIGFVDTVMAGGAGTEGGDWRSLLMNPR